MVEKVAWSPVEVDRITAEDLVLAIEIVTTTDPRKETKDTVFQKELNEFNGVPEFRLAFPDVDDNRAFTFYRKAGDRYEEQIVVPGGLVQSKSVPGLEIRVKPRAEWSPGHKLDIYYQGILRLPLEQEHRRAEAERKRAEASEERAQAERERAEKLAAHLRKLGIDPNSLK